jgi:hypothetical protein
MLPAGVRIFRISVTSKDASAVGLSDGDLVEVRAVGKRIVITPQLAIDRSKFPTADDEYTPEQRRIVNARLDEAEKGPFYGPFKNFRRPPSKRCSTLLCMSKKPSSIKSVFWSATSTVAPRQDVQ